MWELDLEACKEISTNLNNSHGIYWKIDRNTAVQSREIICGNWIWKLMKQSTILEGQTAILSHPGYAYKPNIGLINRTHVFLIVHLSLSIFFFHFQ